VATCNENQSVLEKAVSMLAKGPRPPPSPSAGRISHHQHHAFQKTNEIPSGTIVSTNCIIRPAMRMSRGQMTFYPLKIGDNVFIGPGSHIASISISSNVHIGAGCVLSNYCMIKENCKILPGTVVPPSMVVPPGSVLAGNPARIVGEVGEGWGQGGGGEGEEWIEGGDLRALVRSIK
jgi:dynactin-5